MSFDLFDESWAAAMGEALAENEDYRGAAAKWEGSLVLAWRDRSSDLRAGVYLDLLHGSCRAARAALPEDYETAAFVIAGELPVWLAVLEGRSDPLGAIMRGQLKLARGSLGRLMPFVGAAKELVASARTVPTRFPEEIP